MASRESEARDKRRSRLARSAREGNTAPGYVPPTLDSSEDQTQFSSSTSTREPPSDFVTAPPPVRQGKITSGISMLFRRPSSREPGKRDRRRGKSSADAAAAPKGAKSAAAAVAAAAEPPSPEHKRRGILRPKRESSAKSPAKAPTPVPRSNSRLFYSSQLDDDDSVDSYESRVSHAHSARSSTRSSENNTSGASQTEDSDLSANAGNGKGIIRYRGFSTSLKHLFLDEHLVCASIGCFGLILSQRTEYLLNIRNERRGVSRRSSTKSSGKRAPSRVVSYGLLFTLILLGLTFVIWGFGGGQRDQYAFDGVDYDFDADDMVNYNNNDDNNNNNNGQGDDGNNYNDDGYNNNNNGNDDGYNNNNNNNDDGNGYNNNGYNNGYNNDDGNAYGDDGYNDDDGNRFLESDLSLKNWTTHPIRGIFKIRDYHEGLWQPMFAFVKDEWFRQDEETAGSRFLEDAGFYGYDDYGGNSANNNNNNNSSNSSIEEARDVGSTVRLFLCLGFLVLLGVVGRRRRMRTRYALVRARAQEDHLHYASQAVDGGRVKLENTREDRYEGACSHTLCGCYPIDPPVEFNDDDSSTGTPMTRKRKYMDCVARGFQCLLGTCCGVMCKCWCQCLSVCALAQEAREVRLLVPPRLQRIDFITHQPFHEYQKDVNDLRKGWLGKRRPKGGFMPHVYALSKLSRYIFSIFFFVTVTLLLTLIFNPRASFSWNDGVVLIATFVQSFLVLYVIHWVFHKSDLSLDAVIKFFAAGFLIATPSAFLFEGLLVNCLLMAVYSVYTLVEAIAGEAFVNWLIDNYQVIWVAGELFNAYIVAAVTEELCKYYTFRTVEHPDLIFLTGLDRKAHEKSAVDGGIASYSFASHQVSDFNQRVNSFASESEYSRRSSRSNRSKRSQDLDPSERMIDRTNTQEEYFEDDNDVRTYRQKAAAVTTGMISVAVGLACAENFIYVFLLGGTGAGNEYAGNDDDAAARADSGGVLEEWIVLFFRSIFPIHALAAAMQSVNMIRKFVECTDDNSHNIGVGRIILPAVILHGSFDAVLMGINVYVESRWNEYLEENQGNVGDREPYNPVVVNFVAWSSIIVIMLAGILWYYRENRNQRLRLILLEERDKALEAEEEGSYKVTSKLPRPTDIELV